MELQKSETTGKRPIALVADDQPVNQKLLSLLLDKLGYDSILADDGEDALAKGKNLSAALIFMDIQMPKMDGYEAAAKLRGMGFKNPIIAVTATDSVGEKETCLKAGMDDLLIKPVKRVDLERTLEKWQGRSFSRAEAAPAARPAPLYAGSGRAFNAAEALENFSNSRETILPLLSRFISRTKEQIDNFPGLEKKGDWENARRDAHMIKGAALTMGGAVLGKAASLLEDIYKGAGKEGAGKAYEELRSAFERFRKEAEDYIRSGK